ncbi:Uncharacterised protein [Mycobacteroides abscessus subsp. abscessus]|uniref:hypothetical protein n=1 Tax=Mycobacteroides abscessus TaxID=36809 RepID=UPI00092896E3|nr:hypothetical protein [Mycobacteroides abscessus]SHU66531.1 Uncharacterised protein [Mycobacteroides abscessus subsp. abscessus]
MTSSPGDSEPPLLAVLPEAAELIEYTDAMKNQYEMAKLLAANPGLPPRFKAQQTYTYCVDGEVVSGHAESQHSSPPACTPASTMRCDRGRAHGR